MLTYVIRRLALAIPTLLGAATLTFVLLRLVPGDPARILAGPSATAPDIEQLRHQLGLDRPIWEQYFGFLGGLLNGDLGTSFRTGQSVSEQILQRAPHTLELTVLSMTLATLVGCMLGIVAAIRRGTVVDSAVSVLSVTGVSMPPYWIGLLLIILFSVNLGWFPVAGATTWQSRVLPVVTLALFPIGYISRQTRAAMVETLEMDYIRSARAKGLGSWAVVVHHAFRNAALPIVTIIGLQFGALLGGAVLTETIFAWPGVGRLLVQSISVRDYTTIQGTIFVLGVALIAVNIVVDLIYAYLDPRIRYD